MKNKRYVSLPLVLLMTHLVWPPSVFAQEIESLEVTATGNGLVTESVGFSTSNPIATFSYSADWFRDASTYESNLDQLYPVRPGFPQGGMMAGGGIYFISSFGGATVKNDQWLNSRVIRFPNASYGNFYEIRFTPGGGLGEFWFNYGGTVNIPFEIWNLADTVDDSSDDVRMIPRLFDYAELGAFVVSPSAFTSIFGDHEASTGFSWGASTSIYFHMPVDDSPGDSGYKAWEATPVDALVGDEHLGRITLIDFENRQGMPDMGAIFRIKIADKPVTLASICDDLASSAVQDAMNGNSGKSLLSSCANVQKALDKGNINAAVGMLGALINSLEAHSGKALTSTQVNALVDDLETLIDQLLSGGAGKGAADNEVLELPTTASLHANYPNPFNPQTTISFDVVEAQHARLEVFDTMGRRVALLLDGVIGAGSHSARFDATGLPSGLYVYRLTTPELITSRSMLLLK